MNRDKFSKNLIIVILLGIMILIGTVISIKYYFENKNNNQDTDKKEVEKSNCLYRILYCAYDNSNFENYITFYDFQITNEYDILSTKKIMSFDESKEYYKEAEGEKTRDFSDLTDELNNRKHTKTMDLSDSQKQTLKKLLENNNYNLDFRDTSVETIDNMSYFIANYQNNKALILTDEIKDTPLTSMIYFISKNDSTFFDYLNKDNDFKSYIRDKNYNELDFTSDKITSLYSMATFNRDANNVLDNYIEERITNNMVITLVLQQLEFEKKYKVECEYYEEKYEYCFHLFSDKDVEEYAKKLFGKNIEYDSQNYKGAGDGSKGYFWYSPTEGFGISYGSGSGLKESVIRQPVYAYEIDEKIVIIEKSLLFYLNMPDMGAVSYIDENGLSLRNGIYNNAKDRMLLKETTGLKESYEYYLENYSKFTTYYSYTFIKDDENDYYIAEFSRLN